MRRRPYPPPSPSAPSESRTTPYCPPHVSVIWLRISHRSGKGLALSLDQAIDRAPLERLGTEPDRSADQLNVAVPEALKELVELRQRLGHDVRIGVRVSEL